MFTIQYEEGTVVFIVFWDFLMFEQIFILPQVKRNVIISNKVVYTRVAARATKPLKRRLLTCLRMFIAAFRMFYAAIQRFFLEIWMLVVAFWLQKVYLMLCVGLHVHELKMTPTKRRLFCKILKLKVTNWYFGNGRNSKQTANNFQIDRKQERNWLKDEEKIHSVKLSKKARRYGQAKFPDMEREIYTKLFDIRKEGKHVNHWCFSSKASELVKEKYPGEASCFKLSRRWFEGFCRRYRISLRRRKLTQLKSYQQLYVPLLRNSLQSLKKSAKKALSHPISTSSQKHGVMRRSWRGLEQHFPQRPNPEYSGRILYADVHRTQ